MHNVRDHTKKAKFEFCLYHFFHSGVMPLFILELCPYGHILPFFFLVCNNKHRQMFFVHSASVVQIYRQSLFQLLPNTYSWYTFIDILCFNFYQHTQMYQYSHYLYIKLKFKKSQLSPVYMYRFIHNILPIQTNLKIHSFRL